MNHGQTIPGTVVGGTVVGGTVVGGTVVGGTVQPGSYPLLGQVTVLQPGEELMSHRVFDPAEDLYLRDHTFGRDISVTDPDALALAVMPLTMSLEILAEAAACLRPDLLVVGLREIKAHRWLAWDRAVQRLEVTARRIGTVDGCEQVSVQLRNLDEHVPADGPSTPVVEAMVLLAASYPAAAAATVPDPTGAVPSAWRAEQLYAVGMFHGPRWQGVRSVDLTGLDGATATLDVLPVHDMLRSDPQPGFVLDPVVLDAAGQLIGFWAAEALDRAQIVFPFSCAALEVYGPRRAAGETLRCAARVTQMLGSQLVTSDIEVTDAEGQLWMALRGWQDKRFDAPGGLRGLLGSGPLTLSQPWSAPTEPLAALGGVQCRFLPVEVTSDRDFWINVWSARVLGPRERAAFDALPASQPRRLEWLAARTAAKEAVQHLLAVDAGLAVQQADVEILADADGRPLVTGGWLDAVGAAPTVSLAHTSGYAIAVAAWPAVHADGTAAPAAPLGVDLEQLSGRPAGFAAMAFGPDEQRLLESVPEPGSAESLEEWTLRCWCAKESVAKALGSGLLGDPRHLGVTAIDRRSGQISLQLRGQLADRFGAGGGSLVAYTLRAGPLVVATTGCEPAPLDLTDDLSPRGL
jgi:phosphopantetheinyl transferase